MNNFKVGKKVKCIKVGPIDPAQTRFPPLRINGIYIVHEIKSCPCGEVFMDIGMQTSSGGFCICYCNAQIPEMGIMYANIKRFISAQDQTEEVMKEKEYMVVEVDKQLKEKRKEVIFEN